MTTKKDHDLGLEDLGNLIDFSQVDNADFDIDNFDSVMDEVYKEEEEQQQQQQKLLPKKKSNKPNPPSYDQIINDVYESEKEFICSSSSNGASPSYNASSGIACSNSSTFGHYSSSDSYKSSPAYNPMNRDHMSPPTVYCETNAASVSPNLCQYSPPNTRVRKVATYRHVNNQQQQQQQQNQLKIAHENNSIVTVDGVDYKVIKTVQQQQHQIQLPTIKLEAPDILPTATVYLDKNQPPIKAKPGQIIHFTNGNGIQHLEVPLHQGRGVKSHIIHTANLPEINNSSNNFDLDLQFDSDAYADSIIDKVCGLSNVGQNVAKRARMDQTVIDVDHDLLTIESDTDSLMTTTTTKTGKPKGRPPKQAKEISEEEYEILRQEGLDPSKFIPGRLTKTQEKDLKRVRRKIRNKKSAHESRKRKKVHLETLEQRYKIINDENLRLKTKVKILSKENAGLRKQISKLKAFISAASQRTAQATTCVMLLVLSLAFFLAPKSGPLSILNSKNSSLQRSLDKWRSNDAKANSDGTNIFLSRRILSLYDKDGNELPEPIINEPSLEDLNRFRLDDEDEIPKNNNNNQNIKIKTEYVEQKENFKASQMNLRKRIKREVISDDQRSESGVNSDTSEEMMRAEALKSSGGEEEKFVEDFILEEDVLPESLPEFWQSIQPKTSKFFEISPKFSLSPNLSSVLQFKNLVVRHFSGNSEKNSSMLATEIGEESNFESIPRIAFKKDL